MKLDKPTRLNPKERAALGEYLERLRTRFADCVLRVILSGSRARGQKDGELGAIEEGK